MGQDAALSVVGARAYFAWTAQIPNEERKTLILTGASRGIGHATVKRFSSAGWRVITCSRHGFPEDCPWEAGPEDHIQVDFPDNTMQAIAVMKERLKAQGGRLNALVNNVDFAEGRRRREARQHRDRSSRLDAPVPGELLRADHARSRPDR
jgi:NAD(P)-dependent dehydrogenase (short-subunit alcohol dehydrogenase family)